MGVLTHWAGSSRVKRGFSKEDVLETGRLAAELRLEERQTCCEHRSLAPVLFSTDLAAIHGFG